jgi:Domain of unknown function (DUF4332)
LPHSKPSGSIPGKHGIKTVGDLLKAEPGELASRLGDRHIDKTTITTWQSQAGLCCLVPSLRGHDAQFLTACGVNRREDLAACQAEPLLQKDDAFVVTPTGERILRGGVRPDLKEVTDWITWANRSAAAKVA